MDWQRLSREHTDGSLCDNRDLSEHQEVGASRISDFLSSHGVDTERVKALDVGERNDYLRTMLIRDQVDRRLVERSTELLDSRIGILLIKPEIIPDEGRVVEFLHDKGFEAEALGRIYPTQSEWMDVYGYMLDKHPDIINLYIVQRSLGFRPVVFEHLDTETYRDLLRKRTGVAPECTDRDELFDRLFCGDADSDSPGTLRGEVAFPIMKQLGFNDMSGYASMFDPVNFFRDTGMAKNYCAYNGVHIPSDSIEKQSNINTFFVSRSGNHE